MSQDEATSWLEKAKGDLDVVRRSLMPLPDKNLEAAAYHCQQAAEKSIKALLVHLKIAYPRGGGREAMISDWRLRRRRKAINYIRRRLPSFP